MALTKTQFIWKSSYRSRKITVSIQKDFLVVNLAETKKKANEYSVYLLDEPKTMNKHIRDLVEIIIIPFAGLSLAEQPKIASELRSFVAQGY